MLHSKKNVFKISAYNNKNNLLSVGNGYVLSSMPHPVSEAAAPQSVRPITSEPSKFSAIDNYFDVELFFCMHILQYLH